MLHMQVSISTLGLLMVVVTEWQLVCSILIEQCWSLWHEQLSKQAAHPLLLNIERCTMIENRFNYDSLAATFPGLEGFMAKSSLFTPDEEWLGGAGAAVLAGGHASCSQLSSILPRLPNAFCLAAAALHAPASAAPLPTKLASCKLLALLMPTQEIADVVLSQPSGISLLQGQGPDAQQRVIVVSAEM